MPAIVLRWPNPTRLTLKYAFIHEHRERYPVRLQCAVLGLSRGGYYAYQAQSRCGPDPEHAELLACVKWIAESSGYCYGSRRMHKALNALRFPVSRDQARMRVRTVFRFASARNIRCAPTHAGGSLTTLLRASLRTDRNNHLHLNPAVSGRPR